MLMLVEAADSQPMIGRLATQKELKLPDPAKSPLDLSEKLAAQEGSLKRHCEKAEDRYSDRLAGRPG
ncbi:MAG TPA: hypothetical protein VNX66_19200 [Candidatus Sulfotelmatobacter sp.]|jgi:hypothetical protein|nr:hypothetical protein [Candidatus Sulfotelmatobacter sp.]